MTRSKMLVIVGVVLAGAVLVVTGGVLAGFLIRAAARAGGDLKMVLVPVGGGAADKQGGYFQVSGVG